MYGQVIAAVSLGMLLGSGSSGATPRVLTSATDGNWDDPSCWVEARTGQNGVPTSDDSVVIDDHTIIMTAGEEVAGFHLKDGTLDLGNHLLITEGAGSWDNGLITGAGGFENRGSLTLSDAPTKTLQGVFDNYNRVAHNEGNLHLAQRSVLFNRRGSVYELNSDAHITGLQRYDGSPKLVNLGTFRKAAGTSTSRIEVVFRNLSGTIQVEAGTLSLAGTGVSGSYSSNGLFQVSEGAVLDIGGNNVHIFNGVYRGTGAGRVQFKTGTIKLGTDFEDVSFNFGNGGFHWMGGTMQPVMGGLVNRGLLKLEGNDVKNMGMGPDFRNRGTVVHEGDGNFNLEYGSACRNEAGGTYELKSDASFTASGGEGPKPVFQNNGTFRKTGGAGIANFEAPFENDGVLEIDAGMMNFTDTFVQTGGVTRLQGGDLTASADLDVRGGVLTGAGRVFASVTSAGRVAPGNSAGALVIHGNYQQAANGELSLELGGVAPGTEYDQLHVLGTVTLAGGMEVRLMQGFAPGAGMRFDLITCEARNGKFSSANLPPLPEGLDWDLRYESDGVRLSVVAAETP